MTTHQMTAPAEAIADMKLPAEVIADVKSPAEAIADMKAVYGGAWPPKPDFSLWPASWLPYQRVCDMMPPKLHEGDPPALRDWMKEELESQVNLDAVMSDLYQHWSRSDRQVLGLLGCLACLKNAFRWGALPALQEERERTSMQFPDVIDKPITEVARLHGVPPFGHLFSLHIANTVYENGQPVHIRFLFNADLKIIQTQENFFLPFVIMDKTFQPAVEAMQEYCALTEEARDFYPKAIINLARRLELLEIIQSTIVAVGKVFSKYTQNDQIDLKEWEDYVHMPGAWGLDGKGGGSGGEALIFQLLDEFLHVPGKCLMYTSKNIAQEYMPDIVRAVVKAMAISDPASRFNSYLEIEQSKDPLWKAREAMLRSLYVWRLGHAQVAGRFLTESKGLTSALEKRMDEVESVAAAAKRELLERARETQNQYRKAELPICRGRSHSLPNLPKFLSKKVVSETYGQDPDLKSGLCREVWRMSSELLHNQLEGAVVGCAAFLVSVVFGAAESEIRV